MIFGEKTEEQKRVAELTREVKELRKELLASKLDKKQVEVQMKDLKDALELGGNLRQGYVDSQVDMAVARRGVFNMMEEMNEIHEFMSKFREGVEVIWGVAVDNSLDTKVKITVLATGFGVEDVPGMDTLHEARSQEEEERQLQLEEEKEKNKERIRKAYGESAGIGKKSLRSRRHIYIFNTEDLDNDDIIAEDVLSSGLLAGALMALIYVLSILVGAQSRGIFELSENGGIALTQIAGHYLGGVGQFILAFTITFACLKTSIGLVTACSETFVKMTNGKISYRTWAILFTVFSFAVSNIGLSAIIEYSVPMLMLIYPPAIALILLAFIGKFFAHDRAVYVATMIGTWAAAIFDCMKTLPASVQTSLRLDVPIAFAEKYLPLFDKNLGWLLPALVGVVIGMVIHASRKGTLVPQA